MNIGIDIDNVISNFDTCLLEEYIKLDKALRNNGIINKNAEYITKGMFDFTKEESNNFYYNNIERIVKNLTPHHNAKKYINKLKKMEIKYILFQIEIMMNIQILMKRQKNGYRNITYIMIN